MTEQLKAWCEEHQAEWDELNAQYKKYKLRDLHQLDEQILKKLSLIKDKKGIATSLAHNAQIVLHERHPVGMSSAHWKREHAIVRKI